MPSYSSNSSSCSSNITNSRVYLCSSINSSSSIIIV